MKLKILLLFKNGMIENSHNT